jgi:ABC-type branched-subunit amino acid transport system substrate-binding protein
MVEGFAAAKVLVAGLRRAERDAKTVTRQSLKQALDSLDRFDLGGMEISYNANDHSGLDFTDLSFVTADGNFRR